MEGTDESSELWRHPKVERVGHVQMISYVVTTVTLLESNSKLSGHCMQARTRNHAFCCLQIKYKLESLLSSIN